MSKNSSLDSWIKSLSNLSTLEQRIYTKALLLLPTNLASTRATSFSFVKITPQPKYKHANKFLKRIIGPPNESVYALFWKQTHLNNILATDSSLKPESKPRKTLLEAFENGPPKAYATAKYGNNISASMLFFEHDMTGGPEDFKKGWRGKFIGTFIKWSHEKSPKRFDYYDSGFPSRAYEHSRQKTALPWILGFSLSATDPRQEEHIRILADELGNFFLDVFENRSQAFETTKKCIDDLKKEKNEVQNALQNGKLKDLSQEKIAYFTYI